MKRCCRPAAWLALAALGGLAVLPAVSAAPVFMARGGYAPRDACAGQPGFKPFRASLEAAIRNRDAQLLASLADDDVVLDFAESGGREALIRQLEGAEGATLWQSLAGLMQMGCAMLDGQAVMPWFFAENLGGTDPFDILLVAGRNIDLRSGPAQSAPVLARMSWTLVLPADDDTAAHRLPADPFRQVRLPNGMLGFVEARHLRSPLDYRLFAVPVGRTWRISALVSGD